MPNEMPNNGAALTKPGQELQPIIIQKPGSDDVAVPIPKLYFVRIRPLFLRARSSNAVFPSVVADAPYLDDRIFSNWLFSCSIDIDLRMASHLFRHGLCSIRISENPNFIEDLAVLLGNQPETVRR
ncbi:MAG: hypothetical protein KDK07_25820 [Bauldia sp.]|nr:hypothetical protein [Bauldia sp.]